MKTNAWFITMFDYEDEKKGFAVVPYDVECFGGDIVPSSIPSDEYLDRRGYKTEKRALVALKRHLEKELESCNLRLSAILLKELDNLKNDPEDNWYKASLREKENNKTGGNDE